jgi:hypothetical protein
VAKRHDRREQLKNERRKKQQSRRVTGRRVRPGWVAPAIIAVVAIGGILLLRQIGVFEPPPPAITPPPSGPVEKIGTKHTAQPGTHVATGERVQYAQLPPTSGPHWNLPHAGWGVKDTPQDDEKVVHNLEHGGIVINYKGLSPDDLANLKTLVRRFTAGEYRKVMLRPYDRMDNGIVLTAWNWSHRLDSYDEAVITRFVQGHHGSNGESPEPTSP